MAYDKLTDKQEKFAQYVAEGQTYSDAYKNAYNASKMAINTIYVRSSELMSDSKITVRVAELKKDAVKRSEITLDNVLIEMKNWLFFDPISLIDEETECVKKLKDMSKESRMSISEITVSEIWGNVEGPDGKNHREQIGELKKIKFIDKRATADMFMKKFGAYLDEKEVNNENLEIIKEIIESIKK